MELGRAKISGEWVCRCLIEIRKSTLLLLLRWRLLLLWRRRLLLVEIAKIRLKGSLLLLLRRGLLLLLLPRRQLLSSAKGVPSALSRRWSRRSKVGKQVYRRLLLLLRRRLMRLLLGWHLYHRWLLLLRVIGGGIPSLITVFASNPRLELVLIYIIRRRLHSFSLRVVPRQPNAIDLVIICRLETIRLFLRKFAVTHTLDTLGKLTMNTGTSHTYKGSDCKVYA